MADIHVVAKQGVFSAPRWCIFNAAVNVALGVERLYSTSSALAASPHVFIWVKTDGLIDLSHMNNFLLRRLW